MDIEFKWIGGATWILKTEGITIACDPDLTPSGTVESAGLFKVEKLVDPVYDEHDFDNIDLWLITHNHFDHLNKPGLAIIKPGSRVVTHHNALSPLQKIDGIECIPLTHGEKTSHETNGVTIEVEAMPAIHGVNPIIARLAGGVNGYWISMKSSNEEKSIYIPSDTVAHRKTLKALEGRSVDLLIPNMGAAKKGTWVGTLTLSAKMLKTMIDILSPKLCLPVHFGTYSHFLEPITEVEKLQRDNIIILKPGESYGGSI